MAGTSLLNLELKTPFVLAAVFLAAGLAARHSTSMTDLQMRTRGVGCNRALQCHGLSDSITVLLIGMPEAIISIILTVFFRK